MNYEYIEKIKNAYGKITVIGDFMIDQYYNVNCERISPEYPLPVYISENMDAISVPGGAGNLARQFQDFNVSVDLLSLIDSTSDQLLNKYDIPHGFSVYLPVDKHVPIKQRLFQDQFPLVRWDIESKNYGLKNLSDYQSKLFNTKSASWHNWTPDSDIVLYSDYDKGVFADISSVPMPKNAITIIDPKNGPLSKWTGCTAFKPNSKEAYNFTGLTFWEDQVKSLQDTLQCKMVIITRGGDGVVGTIENELFEYSPITKKAATSVIGGGDTFMAFLALGLLTDIPVLEAITSAWEAGSIYVDKRYNEPVTVRDLKNKFTPTKFISREELSKIDNLVFTNGCFDLGLTRAHIEIIKFAKKQGDKLVVAVNSDASVSRLKGPTRPIMTLRDRMEILAGLEDVDYVVSFEEDTPLEIIKETVPKIIVKGGDYTPETTVGYGICKVIMAPHFDCISTTQKINSL